MEEHTRAERNLKRDIHLKNLLRKDLLSHMRQVQDWREKLQKTRNNRREKKTRESLLRYSGYIDELKGYLLPMLDDLEKRIGDEMSFSEKEIAGFKTDVTQEKKAVAEARKAFESAQAALKEAERKEVPPEEVAETRKAFSGAYKALRLERHRLDSAADELQSEYKDKDFFSRELKRIYVERHLIVPDSSEEG
ncbi:hypothetical protein JW921_10435 [Candidatus Fermentibacterales bacterium]|nr:hypothetical protein [Candidatus Fermentibacterales bacterium]